jgi:hypothetical protein
MAPVRETASAVAMKVLTGTSTASLRADAQRHQGDMQGIGTAGDTDAVAGFLGFRKSLFKLSHVFSLDKGRVGNNVLKAALDLRGDEGKLGFEVEEGDVHIRVLSAGLRGLKYFGAKPAATVNLKSEQEHHITIPMRARHAWAFATEPRPKITDARHLTHLTRGLQAIL